MFGSAVGPIQISLLTVILSFVCVCPVDAMEERLDCRITDAFAGEAASQAAEFDAMRNAARSASRVSSQYEVLFRRADTGTAKDQVIAALTADQHGGTGDWDRAEAWLNKAASKHFGWAEYLEACKYTPAIQVIQGRPETTLAYERDARDTFDWFRRAADDGIVEAMLAVGNGYSDGRGVARDFSEAMRWYSRAASLGAAGAEREIAVMYFFGVGGVSRDNTIAAEWGHRAINHGLKGDYVLEKLFEHLDPPCGDEFCIGLRMIDFDSRWDFEHLKGDAKDTRHWIGRVALPGGKSSECRVLEDGNQQSYYSCDFGFVSLSTGEQAFKRIVADVQRSLPREGKGESLPLPEPIGDYKVAGLFRAGPVEVSLATHFLQLYSVSLRFVNIR